MPQTVTRRVIMQKARHHPCKHRALTACRRTVSGTFNSPYRGTFHLSLALLDSLSVAREYLALGGGPPNFRPDFTWLALLIKLTILHLRLRDCHPLWFRIPSDSSGFRDQRAVPISLAATQGIAVAFFSYGYLDVSVHHVRPAHLCIQCTVIQESWDQRSFDNSPRHFAAFHALHRLLTPRHPPYALTCLTTKIHSQKAAYL